MKKQGNEWAKENKDLRERLESLEKEIRIKSLQPRSPGNYNISSFLKKGIGQGVLFCECGVEVYLTPRGCKKWPGNW